MIRPVVYFLLVPFISVAQKFSCGTDNLPKKKSSQNEVMTCFHDSLQSSFRITVPIKVASHYHLFHTENIFVIQGKAEMLLGNEKLIIRKGNHITIPKGTIHAVLKVKSKKPLVVISVQAPFFDGTDRILVNPNN